MAARRDNTHPLITHFALLLIGAGFFIPFAWMLSTSLKSNTAAMEFPPKLIPVPPNFKTLIFTPRPP